MTSKQLVCGAATPIHNTMLQVLADFLGVDIEYKDLGKGEDITLIRNDGKELTLRARGSRYDGGFLTIDIPEKDK